MAIRSKRTTKRKKTAKKTVSSSRKELESNHKAQWAAYKELQKRVDKAWDKLKSDVHKKARPQVLLQDKNHLMLLLGECNYMASECMRCEAKFKKKAR